MHVDGEIDVRGCYCAITAAKLANFSKADEEEIFENTVDWIASCQTYEGGIGGAPDLEAHGGYAFCGIAALTLLGSTGNLNLKSFLVYHKSISLFIRAMTNNILSSASRNGQ